MLRRALVLAPFATALAAVLGIVFAQRPVVAVVLAMIIGLAVATGLGAVQERRLNRLAAQVRQLPEDGAAAATGDRGSPAWQRLLASLAWVEGRVQERYTNLEHERARVERLLESLPTAIMLFGGAGGLTLSYANPAARALFGVSRTEARTPLQVLGVPALADAVTEANETGRSFDVEVEREGRELLAQASITAEGVVALVMSDLTESRRLEAVRRDFVTNASHELKTPVAGIQALSDSLVLAVDRDPDRARTMIGRLQLEASRLAQLVRDLLDLTRLEERRSDIDAHRRVDLAEIVRTQVDHLRPIADEREVQITIESPDAAHVVGLPTDLRLIVANLIENAVRYNRRGGHVRVSVRRQAGQVLMDVVDDGIGIPELDQDRVFERFYRVDKGRSRAAGGTGLGLAIVRHAAQRHGGEVTVRSVLGEGSSFRVVLPVEGALANSRP